MPEAVWAGLTCCTARAPSRRLSTTSALWPLLHARALEVEWLPPLSSREVERSLGESLAPWRSKPAAGHAAGAIELVSAEGTSGMTSYSRVRCRDAAVGVRE